MDPNTPNNTDPNDRRQQDVEISSSSHSSHTASVNGANEKSGESFHENVGGRKEKPVNSHEKIRNPLAGIEKEQLMADVEAFAAEKGLTDSLPELKKGALIAQDPASFETITELSEDDKEVLRREKTHRWSQPKTLYWMTILCAGSAIVQGMDQTAVNGAQEYYFDEFNIGDDQVWLRGLLNGAPYLCSALIGCWTTKPLNMAFGRRGCIFISCFISFAASFWMAAAHTWWNLLLARFLLGFAVGAKSTTTPVYGSECAPANIRGALVMMWQMWTAFGIMLGFVASVAFMDVTHSTITFLNWRLMLGSTAIPPMFVCVQVYMCPESPRWYMMKNKYDKAFTALIRLRNTKLQAARDLYAIHAALQVENKLREGKNLWKEFFAVPRNRRAAQSAFFVMYMQQFCGVNVIAYYSTAIFREAGVPLRNALIVSLGTGITNWLFAIPAVYTIDTFGRRNLLLTTFPMMSLFLFFTGFSFYIPDQDTRVACVATGIYLFMVVYSPGAGPVPFTYSAEAFPLYIRDVGMSFATAVCWGFNFILSLTWPALVAAFTPQGAFGWYAAWNLFGFFFCYFCLPETKARTLEELDAVFEVATRVHAKYYLKSIPWYVQKYVKRGDVEPRHDLVETYHEKHRAL